MDISKAFELVRWDFLLSVLQAYQVPPSFFQAVRSCICSPSFSIIINGTSSRYFKGKSGLRQGDLLSLALFVMVMNVLSLMLNRAAEESVFHYHPRCVDHKLTHLSFVDDLLIFIEGSSAFLEGVFEVLRRFEHMSGLAVNISKTSMFCSGVDESELQEIRESLILEHVLCLFVILLCPFALEDYQWEIMIHYWHKLGKRLTVGLIDILALLVDILF